MFLLAGQGGQGVIADMMTNGKTEDEQELTDVIIKSLYFLIRHVTWKLNIAALRVSLIV